MRSPGAVPSAIAAMIRGDRKARGASRRMCRSPWADHDDPLGQCVKLHECIADDGVLRAGKAKRDRACASGNHDVTAFERAAFHYDSVRITEAGHPVKGIDALFGKALLALLRHGEGPLESDQLVPVDAEVASDAASMHPARQSAASAPLISIFLGSQPRSAQVSPKG